MLRKKEDYTEELLVYTSYNTAKTNILLTWMPIQILIIFIIIIGAGGFLSILYVLPLLLAIYLFKKDICKLNNHYEPYFKEMRSKR